MKKLLTVMTAMVAGSALYAAPVLNPAEPALITDGLFLCDDDCWGLKAGYRGNFIYDKSFHKSSNSVNNNNHNIYNFGYYSNSGVLTLNLWDRVDVYGFVGAANIDLDATHKTNDTAVHYVDVSFFSKTRTNWGVGAKVVLWETCWGNVGTTYIGLDAVYERLNSASIQHARIIDETHDFGDWTNQGARLGWYETQVSLGIAHRICNLVPYIAVKWSNGGLNGRGNYDNTDNSYDFNVPGAHASRHWGYAFGVTLVDANRMTVTAEARFVDETALSVAAEFKF
jgi:hypothetical protein